MAQLGGSRKKLPFIIALDRPWEESKKWISRMSGEVWGFKVGSILFTEMGPKVVETIRDSGADVFLDLKFHDIPNTVKFSVRRAFELGVRLLTIHASGGIQMLRAAAEEQTADAAVLSVTVLTSLNQSDLTSLEMPGDLDRRVEIYTDLSVGAGVRGIVCSSFEVAAMRKKHKDLIILTPGIRFESSTSDQKRTASAREVFAAGADYAVLGRALTEAANCSKIVAKE
jgi:orotidine-5'-phosphate decarboxylase